MPYKAKVRQPGMSTRYGRIDSKRGEQAFSELSMLHTVDSEALSNNLCSLSSMPRRVGV